MRYPDCCKKREVCAPLESGKVPNTAARAHVGTLTSLSLADRARQSAASNVEEDAGLSIDEEEAKILPGKAA